MAVRVRIRISGPSGEITSNAVLNGGFEIPEPHLLLPAACADRLLGDWRSSGARKPMDAAGGEVVLVAAAERVRGRVYSSISMPTLASCTAEEDDPVELMTLANTLPPPHADVLVTSAYRSGDTEPVRDYFHAALEVLRKTGSLSPGSKVARVRTSSSASDTT